MVMILYPQAASEADCKKNEQSLSTCFKRYGFLSIFRIPPESGDGHGAKNIKKQSLVVKFW
jgi:hypothetical protein